MMIHTNTNMTFTRWVLLIAGFLIMATINPEFTIAVAFVLIATRH